MLPGAGESGATGADDPRGTSGVPGSRRTIRIIRKKTAGVRAPVPSAGGPRDDFPRFALRPEEAVRPRPRPSFEPRPPPSFEPGARRRS